MAFSRWIALFVVCTGCRTAGSWTRAELYFGTQCGPGCTPVSDSDWERFVADQVAPRFPKGFTVLPARGHWLSDGGPQDERTHVLMVIYPADDQDAAYRLQDLRRLYRASFRQEAVLEIDVPAQASF
jgi:hypothetical protein